MFGLHGASLPGVFANISPAVSSLLQFLGINAVAGGGQIFLDQWTTIFLVLPFVFLPNSHELAAMMRSSKRGFGFNNRTAWFVSATLLISIVSLNRESEFLYFQF